MVLIHRNPPPTFADTLDTKKNTCSLDEQPLLIPSSTETRKEEGWFAVFFGRLKEEFGFPSQAEIKAHLARTQHDPDFTVSKCMSKIIPIWIIGTIICLGMYLSHLRDKQHFDMKAAVAIAGVEAQPDINIGHTAIYCIGVSLCGLFAVYVAMVGVANGIERIFASEEERQRDTLSVYAREVADLIRC